MATGLHLGVGEDLVEVGGDLHGRVAAEAPAGPLDVEVAQPAQRRRSTAWKLRTRLGPQ
jgi:hypothetical protein